MTAKDYIRIAYALRAARDHDPSAGYQASEACAYEIAKVMAADNPRFDRERFMAVVRGERKK